MKKKNTGTLIAVAVGLVGTAAAAYIKKLASKRPRKIAVRLV